MLGKDEHLWRSENCTPFFLSKQTGMIFFLWAPMLLSRVLRLIVVIISVLSDEKKEKQVSACIRGSLGKFYYACITLNEESGTENVWNQILVD